jgi:hypothetical protein
MRISFAGGGVVEKCRKSNQFNAQCRKSFEKILCEPNNKYNIIYFELAKFYFYKLKNEMKPFNSV